MTEAQIQSQCVEWFDYQFSDLSDLLFHVPNGGKRTGRNGASVVKQGMRKGVADLILLVPSGKYHGAAIEMKAEKGRVPDAQKEWLKQAANQGYYATLCWSVDEFIEIIHTYFSYSDMKENNI